MATMPPVKLGAIILSGFLSAMALRMAIQDRIITGIDASGQTRRQFLLDLCLPVIAGALAFTFTHLVYGFPLISGISLIFGCLVAGFFMGLDMALDRERRLIRQTLRPDTAKILPWKLYPMTRKFTLIAVTVSFFIAIIIGLVISRDISWLSRLDPTDQSLAHARLSVMYELLFIMAVLLGQIVNLIISYSKNLKLLFDNETGVLERVTRGDLSKLVPVATNDEFGAIAGHTNTMIHGLRHRIKLISAIKLAEEVQQNLLPQAPPVYPGLDMAGASQYCDETGGDYYDFLSLPDGRVGVVVVDAADHGVGAALHMTTTRAFLISGARNYQDPGTFLREVNGFLTRDSRDTGRFATIFFLELDTAEKRLKWVRAGHEPALLYDPEKDRFVELRGKGTALGVVDPLPVEICHRNGWTPGTILLINTDGIREARNPLDEMYGLQRMKSMVRSNANRSAQTLLKALLADLELFQAQAPQTDDYTLVIVKLG